MHEAGVGVAEAIDLNHSLVGRQRQDLQRARLAADVALFELGLISLVAAAKRPREQQARWSQAPRVHHLHFAGRAEKSQPWKFDCNIGVLGPMGAGTMTMREARPTRGGLDVSAAPSYEGAA